MHDRPDEKGLGAAELVGIPQIPNRFAAMLQTEWDPEPTGELADECDEAIAAACREIQRRRLKRRRQPITLH